MKPILVVELYKKKTDAGWKRESSAGLVFTSLSLPPSHTYTKKPSSCLAYIYEYRERKHGWPIDCKREKCHSSAKKRKLDPFCQSFNYIFSPLRVLIYNVKIYLLLFPSLFGSVSLFLSQWALKTLSSTWKKSERKMI